MSIVGGGVAWLFSLAASFGRFRWRRSVAIFLGDLS